MSLPQALATGLFLFVSAAGAEEPSKTRLREDLYALASPSFEGRATGTKGQRLAADLIARRFQEAGLDPVKAVGFGGATPYHWPYALERRRLDESGSLLKLGSRTLKLGSQAFTSRAVPGDGEAVLLGYGLKAPALGWDDYGEADMRGKWVVAFDGEAPRPAGVEAAAWTRACASEAKAATAQKAGALGLILLQDGRGGGRDLTRLGAVLSRFARSGRITLKGTGVPPPPTILIGSQGLKAFPPELPKRQELLDATRKPMAPLSLGRLACVPKSSVEDIPASNVMGLLPGSDPALRDEIIVLSAHHDHVGFEGGELHPGADDNGSGTSVLMEVARLLRDTRPRRSILFLSVSGEEIGLFGSQAFAAAPPVELDRVKADLNIDMVGRNSPGELSVTPARIEGAVSALTERARNLANAHGLRLTDEADTYWTRSDHYTFFKQGIPAIFFFGGMHKDYHKPTDTPDKISFEKLVRVAAFVRDLALATANAAEAPKILPKAQWSLWTWPSQPGQPAPAP